MYDIASVSYASSGPKKMLLVTALAITLLVLDTSRRWGGSSIRTKMNGSVLYAMFCWQVFRIAVGLATRLPNESAPESSTIQPGALHSSQCDPPTLDPRFVA
jgi:hypothetical protein